jgi:hypothetical protein
VQEERRFVHLFPGAAVPVAKVPLALGHV